MAIAAIGEGTGKVCHRFTLSKFNGYSFRRSLSLSAVLLRGDLNRRLVGGGRNRTRSSLNWHWRILCPLRMFLYLGHAKGTREDCWVCAFSFLIDETKRMLMRLLPSPCTHSLVVSMFSDLHPHCVSVYLSSSAFLFRREFARPCLFAIVSSLHFVFFSRYVWSCRWSGRSIFRGQLCTDLEVRIHSLLLKGVLLFELNEWSVPVSCCR